MGRVLGLTQYLNESHLAKQGLRFWFTNDEVRTLAEASELGPLYQVRVPSYQLDRATFDEEVLRRAGVAGAHVVRPATITDVQLCSGKEQTVTYRDGDETKTVRSRWIVDASGVAAILARRRVGGNLTPSTRLRRRGRDGKASKIGTAASWPRNIRNGREPFMPRATPPLIMSLVMAGGAGGSHSKAAT